MCESELKSEQEMEMKAAGFDSKNDDICIEGGGDNKSQIPNPKSQTKDQKAEAETEVNPIKNMGIIVLGMN